jgi:hypothetical protein
MAHNIVQGDDRFLLKLPEMLNAPAVEELFRAAIGHTQFERDIDLAVLVRRFIKAKQKNPEKFNLKDHQREHRFAVDLVGRSRRFLSEAELNEKLERVFSEANFEQGRARIVSAIASGLSPQSTELRSKIANGEAISTEEVVADAVRSNTIFRGQSEKVGKILEGKALDRESLEALHDWTFGYFVEHYLGQDRPVYVSDELREKVIRDLGLENINSSSISKTLRDVDSLFRGVQLKTGQRETIRLVPTKGLGRIFSGDISDACTTSQYAAFAKGKFPEITSYVLVSGEDSNLDILGAVLFVSTKTADGRTVLHVRANNPKENLRAKFDTETLVEGIIDVAIKTAKEGGYDAVSLPLDVRSGSSSNREFVARYYFENYSDLEKVALEQSEATTFNGYPNWDPEGAHPSVIVWQRSKAALSNHSKEKPLILAETSPSDPPRTGTSGLVDLVIDMTKVTTDAPRQLLAAEGMEKYRIA